MKKTALAVCIGALLAGVSLSSQACFTVIVGKDASATGEIIIGHNEDNDRRINIGCPRRIIKPAK